eukprot:3016745-Pyramimonas_sp.AAC.2
MRRLALAGPLTLALALALARRLGAGVALACALTPGSLGLARLGPLGLGVRNVLLSGGGLGLGL